MVDGQWWRMRRRGGMLLAVVVGGLWVASGRAPHRDVATSQGAARGYLAPAPPHYVFLGLPYGRPPARHHRFKAPKPPKQWDGTYEATYRVKCPQPGGEGDENCLVLNIFTPEEAKELPVLVMVHDGAFQYGWGSFQPPARLLQHFVIVTFNYRVGALGFLCLGTPEVPGNAGLKDQIAALYWIQRNIANFGGSPTDVTVYGVGAGAAAVELLLLSNLSQGLLHKVILESGSALSPLSTTYDPVALAMDAASMLEYDGSEDLSELATFFEQISANQLTKVGKMFLPCIDRNPNGLFDMDPVDILKSGKYHKVPMLVAYTDKIVITEMERETFSYMPQSFEHLLPNNLEFPNEDVKEKIAEFVREFYFDQEDANKDLVENYMEYFKDITIEYPVIKSAAHHAAGCCSPPVYLMKFTYNTQVEDSESIFLDQTLLNNFYAIDNLSDNDELVAQRLITLWSNFIKIGDPTPLTTTLIPVVWPPIQVREQLDADISEVTGLEIRNNMVFKSTLTTQQVVFWNNVYKKFYRKHK